MDAPRSKPATLRPIILLDGVGTEYGVHRLSCIVDMPESGELVSSMGLNPAEGFAAGDNQQIGMQKQEPELVAEAASHLMSIGSPSCRSPSASLCYHGGFFTTASICGCLICRPRALCFGLETLRCV